MKQFVIISAIFSIIVLIQSASAQDSSQNLPICNGMATYLPKPEFGKIPQDANVTGSVSVKILIDENGKVENAQAVSGHPILRDLAEKAAKQATFTVISDLPPRKFDCFLVYNFVGDEKTAIENKFTIMLGILNEKALILQMPNYPPSAKPDFSGSVNVKTKIDLQKGEVVSVEAISGHPLLRMQAEKAALQAKFPPALTEFSNVFGQGFLIYKIEDFNGKTIENKTPKNFLIIEKGVVNDRAKSLPKPQVLRDIKATGIVEVKVLIGVLTGKVVLAKAVSDNSVLHTFAESAARKAEFHPALINTSEPIYVKASLLYKFNSDHTVETNLTDKDLRSVKQKENSLVISCGQCGSEPVFLAKPEYPKAAIYVKAKGAVGVEILIDENGNVESAKAVSGHPLLRAASEKAALESKFTPKTLSGKPVKVRGYIVYNFTS